MKNKIFFLGICLVSYFSSFAQFHKNDFKSGMIFRLMHQEQGDIRFPVYYKYKYSNSGFSLTPALGFFISDHFELGIGIGYNSSKSIYYEDSISLNDQKKGINTTLFGNKYFLIGDKFSFFLSSSVQFDFSTNHLYTHNPGLDFDRETNVFDFSIGISPGIAFAPVKRFMLSASYGNLGFSKEIQRDKETREIKQKISKYGLQLDTSSFLFGIYYIF